ncbi:hypothetical protein L2E82_05485 [Cichorium intybus]|uniref:Uncharacterized protein n=1 Tax=Cichorium intybus TaxID=13427 RepID=A0ACB9H8I7_CICIN|nr:hypothetical protein L2E82_05485 [Cichorium intybus]
MLRLFKWMRKHQSKRAVFLTFQSTQSFKSLLKGQDISFTTPLCNSKLEQATTEDLFELSEIEKHNIGNFCDKTDVDWVECWSESCPFGGVSHQLSHGFLKGLKYSDEFHGVSLARFTLS